MGVAPAGTDIDNTGHHHLVIDTDLPDLDKPVPSDKNHKHFGKGQTETSINMEPGKHTLQLLLGDHTHIPHQPPLISEKITHCSCYNRCIPSQNKDCSCSKKEGKQNAEKQNLDIIR